jgi:hypothetical protein
VAPIAKGRVSVLHKGLARAIAWLSKLIAVVVAIVIVASIFAVVDDARTALSVRQPHAANR